MKRTMTFAASLLAATVATTTATPALAADLAAGTYAASGIDLTFDGNGHFRGSQKDAVVVEGEYKATGDQLEFADKSGPWACPAAQTGTYRWKSTGDTLTFSKVSDACSERVQSLTARAWKKQS
ncbi:MAG TPA: hypothetical protein VH814_21710 [Steroidobacteraceae bacterium]|jgi:hypothetical protein